MSVQAQLFMRPYGDAEHAHVFVLELDVIMLRVDGRGVEFVGWRGGRRASAWLPRLDLHSLEGDITKVLAAVRTGSRPHDVAGVIPQIAARAIGRGQPVVAVGQENDYRTGS